MTVFSGVVATGTGILFIVTLSSGKSLASTLDELILSAPGGVFCAIALLAAIGAWALRRRPVSGWALAWMDFLLAQVLFAALLNVYVRYPYDTAPAFRIVVPALAVTILTRAVLVPSSTWRTLLFSAGAPLALLVIDKITPPVGLIDRLQINTEVGAVVLEDLRHSEGHQASTMLLNQIVLWWAVGAAVLASRVNAGLRRRVFAAGRLGAYELGEEIGSGAMGQVFRATHALLKRPTAIKLLRPEITGAETLARFEREVQQTSRLTHPNTISVYDYGHTAEGVFYYAMELLDGLSLGELLERHGPQPAARVCRILVAASGALAEAHDREMVHRDVKPDNIMLCRLGGELDVVKLLDFGLVKDIAPEANSMTLAGALVGTPETCRGRVLFGCVCHGFIP